MSGDHGPAELRLPLNVLWVDDDERAVIDVWGPALQDRLRPRNVTLRITALNQGRGVRETVIDDGADLLILDIDLDRDPQFPNAFLLLKRMDEARISRPVVLFSGRSAEYSGELKQYRDRYLGAFDKSDEGIEKLAELIAGYVERPPVTAVVMSDLHVGRFVQERRDLERFFAHLERDFDEVRSEYQVNHLLMLGDFVWKGSKNDVHAAHELIQRIRRTLRLAGPRAFHFCPGNHDLDRTNATDPWGPVYWELVNRLALDDEGVVARYRDDVRAVRHFRQPESVVAFGTGATHGVGFGSLSSVDQNLPEQTRLGRDQFEALEARMKAARVGGNDGGGLKIALMHHSLYPAPFVGQDADAQIPADSARTYRELSRLGFELLLTGHNHYSCVHAHELAVLNSGNDAPASRRLVAVSLATLGGEPSPATPFQQYYVLRIGHQTPTGTRLVEIASRIFDADEERFYPGDSVELEIGQPAMICKPRPRRTTARSEAQRSGA